MVWGRSGWVVIGLLSVCSAVIAIKTGNASSSMQGNSLDAQVINSTVPAVTNEQPIVKQTKPLPTAGEQTAIKASTAASTTTDEPQTAVTATAKSQQTTTAEPQVPATTLPQSTATAAPQPAANTGAQVPATTLPQSTATAAPQPAANTGAQLSATTLPQSTATAAPQLTSTAEQRQLPTTTMPQSTATTNPQSTTVTTQPSAKAAATHAATKPPAAKSAAAQAPPAKVTEIANAADLHALVNKQHALPASYIPSDLVKLKVPFSFAGDSPKKMLRKEAAAALEALFAEAAKEKIKLVGVSGYRPYLLQEAIFASNVKAEGFAEANRTSAIPGQSEHQTGLAIDVSSPVVKNQLTEKLGTTAEGKWLAQNAYRFGYTIRYPEGKEAITGYSYEPWHIRYVGKEIAQVLHDKQITLEEYYKPVSGDHADNQ